jgi:hypothetical protein
VDKIVGTLKKETTCETQFRMEDNIKTDLQKFGWDGMDWIELAEESGQNCGYLKERDHLGDLYIGRPLR